MARDWRSLPNNVSSKWIQIVVCSAIHDGWQDSHPVFRLRPRYPYTSTLYTNTPMHIVSSYYVNVAVKSTVYSLFS